MPEMKTYEINGVVYDIRDSEAARASRTINGKTLENDIVLGANDVSARPNTWLPTIAEIGAAPAGYGLGGTRGKICTDVDTATEIGFYCLDGSTLEDVLGNFSFGTMAVERKDGYIYQTIKARGGFRSLQIITRVSVDWGATWGPWEYVNPPMLPGVEYRTTERIDGNVVYKKKDSSGTILYRLDGETEWKKQNNLVGAAPAGYGLGEPPKDVGIADLDNIYQNGWYRVTVSGQVGGVYTEYADVRVDAWGQNRIKQTLSPHNTYGSLLIRRKDGSGGGWQEWEWVNPPMAVGVEYRTTERWNGKPVYWRLVDFGYLPNNTSKKVSFGNASCATFFAFGITTFGTLLNGTNMNDHGAALQSRWNEITITTGTNQSAYTAAIFVKYYKTTD